jgi:hypothetical protein
VNQLILETPQGRRFGQRSNACGFDWLQMKLEVFFCFWLGLPFIVIVQLDSSSLKDISNLYKLQQMFENFFEFCQLNCRSILNQKIAE